jgi:general stress protein 26
VGAVRGVTREHRGMSASPEESTPDTARPHMPGYGILPSEEGTGLLPWSWAEERLRRSHDFWLGTVWPDGRPHVMPVWGVWDGSALWFSTSNGSRKSRNLLGNGRCVLTTDNALEPVILEGAVELVTDAAGIETFVRLLNEKYGTDYDTSFQDPAVNRTFRVLPERAFGLTEEDFIGSPTRWTFARS